MISYKKIMASIVNQCIVYSVISLIFISTAFALDAKIEKPNILWIVSEDNSPLIGAYGDSFATTPNIDKLAKQSIVYDNAFANSPVCAPTRFSIITGMHANAMGTGNMRSRNKIPAFVKTYTHYLRAANYHVTNNSKTDYNFATADIPDGKLLKHKEWQAIDSQLWNKGSYADRQEGQPFFHVYNISESHESRLHRKLKKRLHRPEDVTLPPYHPDTLEIRNDWALYYDRITQMDSIVGNKLTELEAAGELENTIVFYYSDHGGALARSKRFLYDTGTKIPFMVHAPKKYQHLLNHEMSSRTDQLIDIVDLAPTLLYLAGIKKPAHMHGENIFSSADNNRKQYNYLYRGRMDARIDLVRALRNEKFKYIRNYMPHRPNGQHLSYLWKAASVRSWQQACQQNQCNETQQRFWQARPSEELYDTSVDPWEVNNLANDGTYSAVLSEMRTALQAKNRQYKDIGFIPEGELAKRTKNKTGYELVREDNFPIDLIIETAEIASLAKPKNLPLLTQRLSHQEPIVRYWAAMGCTILKEQAMPAKLELSQRLRDDSADVQIAAAEALIHIGNEQQALVILMKQLTHPSAMVRIHAANALDAIGIKAKPVAKKLKTIVTAMQALKTKELPPEEKYLLSALSHTVSKL